MSADAKLPVAVWIHGGGLMMGGTRDRRYNLTFIVENSVEIGQPMIAVSIAYRLSAWGFLGGSRKPPSLISVTFHSCFEGRCGC